MGLWWGMGWGMGRGARFSRRCVGYSSRYSPCSVWSSSLEIQGGPKVRKNHRCVRRGVWGAGLVGCTWVGWGGVGFEARVGPHSA